PSGCGKTTLLRMIIGFNTVEGGDILVDGKSIVGIATNRRNMGMVFQNYAIFPHMSVEENVAYGLKTRKTARDEAAKRVDEILRTVRIENLKHRKPAQLSGGQQQRVALARAIVIRPGVLLMDEPLSNLDAKLRVEMRNAIKNIQHQVGITTVYVTHDQEEALAISDRIAVMNGGVVQQIGTPKTIYQRPANLFVASFIGLTNVLKATLHRKGGCVSVDFGYGYQPAAAHVRPDAEDGMALLAAVRPEDFAISTEKTEGVPATVRSSVFLGVNTHYFLTCDDGTEVEALQSADLSDLLPDGSRVWLRANMQKCNLFDAQTEKTVIGEEG
ncbi:MAG: ABC transporter ATP-binding protein, partial [Clostridia bacterium]|nr:ABC transporter ATP-binding protein [Clostridia bacterium]